MQPNQRGKEALSPAANGARPFGIPTLHPITVGSVIYAVTVPNTFSDGMVISAADINA
ncbi:MAG: hypothetical protein IID61_14560 [SAR324 cluster bacterium]|nr:hypothetical protein [SAR324 cluster bacterium]